MTAGDFGAGRFWGGAIFGTERHTSLWDWNNSPVAVIEVEPGQPANRRNEGVVGPDGAFWIGTMLNNINDDDSPSDISHATGSLYRDTSNGALQRVSVERFGITNTFVFPSPDELLSANTLANATYAYQISPGGQLTRRRRFMSGFRRGPPDGLCLDAEGRLWTARVAGGSCLTCITADGRIDKVVELPCSWPTSGTFGGPDFATLYVTSARFTMTDDHLTANAQEGGLFALELAVQGCPANLFGAIA